MVCHGSRAGRERQHAGRNAGKEGVTLNNKCQFRVQPENTFAFIYRASVEALAGNDGPIGKLLGELPGWMLRAADKAKNSSSLLSAVRPLSSPIHPRIVLYSRLCNSPSSLGEARSTGFDRGRAVSYRCLYRAQKHLNPTRRLAANN